LRPTNCTLSGTSSAENPHGTDKVRLPLKLNGWVWMSFRTVALQDFAVSSSKEFASLTRALLVIDGHTQSMVAIVRLEFLPS
jgi:hypothetical protein